MSKERYYLADGMLSDYCLLSGRVYYNYTFGTYFMRCRGRVWLRWDWTADKFVYFSYYLKPPGIMAKSSSEELIYVVKRRRAALQLFMILSAE